MKKVLSIVAVAVFSLGLFSCDSDNTAEDQLFEVQANDQVKNKTDGRD